MIDVARFPRAPYEASHRGLLRVRARAFLILCFPEFTNDDEERLVRLLEKTEAETPPKETP